MFRTSHARRSRSFRPGAQGDMRLESIRLLTTPTAQLQTTITNDPPGNPTPIPYDNDDLEDAPATGPGNTPAP
ncbi:hypothetical protein [Paludisphaera sp.]|uniref:hypothetical protein n=1 Tax=Paludisphaera sp. TaxID=2017432 RepID=UPI00301C7113